MPYTKSSTANLRPNVDVNRIRTTWSAWYGTTVTDLGPVSRPGPNWIYKSKMWNVQANWKALRRSQGYLPTLEYANTQRGFSGGMTPVKWRNSAIGVYEWYDENPLVITPSYPTQASGSQWPTSTTLVNLALDAQEQCLEKARDMKVNIPVLFGEGRQTVRMIRDTAETLGRAYRAFRRGRFKKAAEVLGIQKPTGQAANHWLAYSYGWRPLLSDAKGLAELAAQQLELGGRPPRMTVRGRAVKDFELAYAVNGGSLYGGVTVHHEGKCRAEGHAGLLLEMQYSSSALAAQTGFGLTDPLLVAWELTPFSFVFDWFVDVGGYLERASALQGWIVKAGFYSYQCGTTELSYRCSENGTSQYKREQGIFPTGVVYERSYYRTPWMGENPPLRFKMLGDALNARRLITSAALWRQRLRGDRNGSYRP